MKKLRMFVLVLILITLSVGCQGEQSIPNTEPALVQPQELSEQSIANLTAFAKLYGYVRYFHPSDQVAEADWEQVALRGTRAVVNATTPEELDMALEGIFIPLAPTVQIFVVEQESQAVENILPPEDTPDLQVVMWEHHGVAGGTAENEMYQSTRLMESITVGEIPEGFADPQEPFYADLGAGVAANIPLAVYADANGTWPHDFDIPEKLSLGQTLTPEQANQLAGVVIAWNIFQHFYPYFDVIDTDWEQLLPDSLAEAYQISNDVAYHDFLLAFVAVLQDSHGSVWGKQLYNHYHLPPVILDWVENQVVVIKAFREAKSLVHPGDVVLAVNGTPISEYLAWRATRISAATVQWERFFWLAGPENTDVSLDIQTPTGEQKNVTLTREYYLKGLSSTSADPLAELEPGIFYVDLASFTEAQFNNALPELKEANGIIFDFRGYPQVPATTIGHFVDQPVSSAQWQVPVSRYPDQQNVTFDVSSWDIEPAQPRLTDNLVFLINGRVISYAETYLGIIEHYQIGEIVGQPTAGTNGDVNSFSLPWDFATISWTGMKVLKHDGSQLHGVGIQPDVPVTQTIQSLAEGRDLYLETALEIIKQNQE